MIVLDLCCPNGHRFEGWFASAMEFDRQSGRGLVTCPVCDLDGIERRPSAPNIHIHSTPAPDAASPAVSRSVAASEPPTSTTPVDPQVFASRVVNTLRQLASGAENVGERFPEEARRIHYKEAEPRSICGQASPDEVETLIEEGITILPVPPGGNLH